MYSLKKSKNGFTLTELAIVIAVIAILIAVLVPTFVSLINNANESADQQTVKNLNTALSVDEAENGTPEYLCAVWEVLEDAGYNPTPTPTYSDNEFYWYKEVNRIVIVSKESQIITFPTEYAGLTAAEAATESGNTTLCAAKAAAAATGTVSLTALDTDEDLYSVHHFENGVCTICNKDRSVSAGSDSNIADTIAKSGYITLSEDITVSSSVSYLLVNSKLEDVSINLNDNTLTLTNSLHVANVDDKTNPTPIDVTISDGEIDCSANYLRIDTCNDVTIENVTFSSDSTTVEEAIKAYATKGIDTSNTYTFKNCTFANTNVAFYGYSGTIFEYNVIFEDCIFTCTSTNSSCVIFDKYVYGTALFKNCTFNVIASSNTNTPWAIKVDTNSDVGENRLNITFDSVKFYGTPKYASSYSCYKIPKVISSLTYATVTETGTNEYYLIYGNDYYSFKGYTSITDITIPDTATSIPDYAFSGLTTLQSVTIGGNVSSIGKKAFYNCSKLTSIEVSEGSTLLKKGDDGNLYYNTTTLVLYLATDTSFTIPNTVTKIGDYAFCSNTTITSVTIPDSVTAIGEYAFSECTKLTSITIPDSVKTIGQFAFYKCTSAETLTIGNSVETIDYYAFGNCSKITSVVIPDSVTSLGSYAFKSCTALTSVTLSENMTSIGSNTFDSCKALTSITIPNKVETIGMYAFQSCSKLESVTIGSGITSIGNSAFNSCSALTTVYYVGSQEDWNNIDIYSNNNSYLTGAAITYNYSVTE